MREAKALVPRAVTVVVLGDVGRSPRMQYHCASLLGRGVEVTLVGYRGEACIQALESNPLLHKALFEPTLSGGGWRWLKSRAYLAFGVVKAVTLMLRLLAALLFSPVQPDLVLVQNPPAIPTLAAAWLACRLRGCALVIDWHNLGFTMLPHRGDGHPVRRLARLYERVCAGGADAHLCVTRAMRHWLRENFGVEASVLHDRPPDFFRPTSLPVAHGLFLRLAPQLSAVFERCGCPIPSVVVGASVNGGGGSASAVQAATGSQEKERYGTNQSTPRARAGATETTPFTRRLTGGGEAELLPGRPALLVSSTSWTLDEDFSLLLEALVRLDAACGDDGGDSGVGPLRLVVVVTGKGPQRRKYERRMAALRMRHMAVCTAWLEAADYPLLLGCADLGVSLHTSTSG
ncbi:unnamed protein product, partial [Phaeothamnion confervicola]